MLEITPLRADDPALLEAAFSAIRWTVNSAPMRRTGWAPLMTLSLIHI